MKRLLLLLLLSSQTSYAFAELLLSDEWARLIPSGVGSVYVTIENKNSFDEVLLSAKSDSAKMAMIHETVRENNVVRMNHIVGGINIPKGENTTLEPGGYHIMLININKNLSLGDRIKVTLIFEKSGEVILNPILKLKPPF